MRSGGRAVGYVRVSTELQAQEGVSLAAQQVKLRAYCVAQGLTLVEVCIDAGESAGSLERPGLQAALRLLQAGRADVLVVAKLDRLTRSVRDLGLLCEVYFGAGRPWSLLSVGDSIDTRTAGGKLVLNVLTSVAQWEREAIGDRTRQAMQHLKQQGVAFGRAPYGWRYSDAPDRGGRRFLVEDPEEQAGIRRVWALYAAKLPVDEICRALEAEGIPARGGRWHRRTIYRVLHRAGQAPAARPRRIREAASAPVPPTVVRDRSVAAERARRLRAQGLSLRQIAERLAKERLLPARGERWHAAGVLELLRLPLPKSGAQ